MNWATRKWKPVAEINGWHTQPVAGGVDPGGGDGIVFGIDRDGNPHHGSQVMVSPN